MVFSCLGVYHCFSGTLFSAPLQTEVYKNMRYFEWIVWTLLAFWTAFTFVTWLVKKREYKSGCYYDTEEVMALYAMPKKTFVSTVILVIFVFLDFNKLHLLWIYPVVNFYIGVKIAKWVCRKDGERLNKEVVGKDR